MWCYCELGFLKASAVKFKLKDTASAAAYLYTFIVTNQESLPYILKHWIREGSCIECIEDKLFKILLYISLMCPYLQVEQTVEVGQFSAP